MANEPRTPRFELHIRPMIRLLDRDHMLPFPLDLWDYETVRGRASEIMEHLKGETTTLMPVENYGGPWPAEWVSLFQRWVTEGCPKLDLGQVNANGYKVTVSGISVTIMGVGRFPTTGYRAWLEPQLAASGLREYMLYWEPPVPAQTAAGGPFRVREQFTADPLPAKVVVVDADGRHEIAVPGEPTPAIATPGPAAPVVASLLRMGAERAGDSPTSGFSLESFRLGEDTLHVFSDGNFTHVEGPASVLEDLGNRTV